MPLHHEGLIPLRLDSRVILYKGSGTSRYSLYESYAVKGGPPITERISEWHPRYGAPGVQFIRHEKFKAWVKAWVKDEIKDAFRKALDREMVKAWVKAVKNVY